MLSAHGPAAAAIVIVPYVEKAKTCPFGDTVVLHGSVNVSSPDVR